MKHRILIKNIIETVPQWYICGVGPNKYNFSIMGDTIEFCASRYLTPNLTKLYSFMNENLTGWANQLPENPTLSSLIKIKEDIALCWLRIHDDTINWSKILAYLDNLKYRTYENQPVSINIIIKDGKGSQDLTSEEVQKLTDPLGNSTQVCFIADKELNFLEYLEIQYDEIKDAQDYKFNPEFLQPFVSKLETGCFSVHLTNRGDIVILNKLGILAANRKGRWFIYDVQTMKNTIGDVLGDYRIGCNVFELVFDLSYKRHGALLVYDPDHTVLKNIINTESIIFGNAINPDPPRRMLAASLSNIAMGSIQYKERKKRILMEVASLDGAIVFDGNNILAFGAMIKLHPGSAGFAGARTTAAHSAFKWGGRPIKISSDGDITILFNSRCGAASQEARLLFL